MTERRRKLCIRCISWHIMKKKIPHATTYVIELSYLYVSEVNFLIVQQVYRDVRGYNALVKCIFRALYVRVGVDWKFQMVEIFHLRNGGGGGTVQRCKRTRIELLFPYVRVSMHLPPVPVFSAPYALMGNIWAIYVKNWHRWYRKICHRGERFTVESIFQNICFLCSTPILSVL